MTCQKCVDAISNSLHGKEGISESYNDAMVCFTCFNNIDANQKVHVPEMDCSAEANNWLCMCFIERRSVTSHTHGSKISGSQQFWNLSNNRPRQQQESLDWQNNNLSCPSHNFVHFLTSLHDCNMKLLYFTHPFFRVREHSTKKFFFFC